jgi:hypothetical protein
MISTARKSQSTKPAPLDVFLDRCDAQAILAANGQTDLADAVDALQAAAERTGVVGEVGQDAVQAIMAKAFARWR